ncbi:MAG TPA: hypothetical protein PK147_00185 [Saprospiraceae bacterium]|nr:hypothetical protein [Saprospiraceae bacterium]MCB9328935.1 hypothetical protein [Lewinellaceae bacterium]HPK08747.1 hypothetical protein [Saprospiraceae bacterium]HPQ20231.1 hypothetical protein [Saprospiraceae bacterium]HRX28157.1 hypothetical protein [Saprospiraceae bacterium]
MRYPLPAKITILCLFFYAFNSSYSQKTNFKYEAKELIFTDQYFVLPSNFNLPANQAYYKNQNLFLNSFYFGMTENFSLGMGFEGVSIVEKEFPNVFLMPRFSLGEDKVKIGFNGYIFLSNQSHSSLFMIVHPSITLGQPVGNISFGILKAMLDSSDDLFKNIIITTSFNFKLGAKVLCVGEFYFSSEQYDRIFFSNVGVKILGKKLSIDFSIPIEILTGESSTVLFGFSIPFRI